MTLLLQLSDPHFGTEQAPVATALQRLAAEQRPDVLLLSGDITQRATHAQFAAARAYVDTLGVPSVLAIPGNHDIPLFNLAARSFWPYAGFKRAFGEALEGEFENDDLLLLALNTTRRWRHVDGELSPAQIERVVARLQHAPRNRWRLVATHQPMAVPRPQDESDLLHGHAPALQRWAEAGVDVVMGGHIHLPYVLPMRGHPTAMRPALWVVQAGTALSHRVRRGAPNSVNLLRIDAGIAGAPRRLQVEQWDHDATAQRFECVKVQRLRDHDHA